MVDRELVWLWTSVYKNKNLMKFNVDVIAETGILSDYTVQVKFIIGTEYFLPHCSN